MSELAFNANGDAFEVPANVSGWRVRRMKPRGAPELVYGADGGPLTVHVDTTIDELREAVGIPGKYRLDPVNDDGKCVEAVPPAYVHVARQARNADAGAGAGPSAGPSDDAVREAMRLNTELAKSVIDKFPEMMTAAAELIRAADGACIPARQPRIADEDEEGDDVVEHAKPSIDLVDLAVKIVPLLVGAIASGDKSRLPNLAEMLDWRRAVPNAKKPVSEAAAPTSEAAPTAIPPDAMTKVAAVLDKLAPEERMLAVALAQELSGEERMKWFTELAPLSIDEAVVRVRKLLSSTKGAGGAS